YRRFERRWRSAWAGRWPPRWCGDCWHGTGGVKWPPIHATPRAIRWRSRRGKKTPQNAGYRREASRTAWARGASNVPGRGPIWQDGASPALLGTAAVATGDAQWLRTTVHVCLRGRQSAAGGTRLDDLSRDEHRAHGRISRTSQPRPSRRIHRDDRGWRQLA